MGTGCGHEMRACEECMQMRMHRGNAKVRRRTRYRERLSERTSAPLGVSTLAGSLFCWATSK